MQRPAAALAVLRLAALAPGPRARTFATVPHPSGGRNQGDVILETEYARVEAGEKMASMDTKRYNLDAPPAAKRNDYAAWRSALDNAHSQLEHQYNRCTARLVGWYSGWAGLAQPREDAQWPAAGCYWRAAAGLCAQWT